MELRDLDPRLIFADRRALLALVVGVPLVLGAIAVPAFMSGDDVEEAAEVAPQPAGDEAAREAEPTPEEEEEPVAEAAPAPDPGPQPTADGSLTASVRLRWSSFPQGIPIAARVQLQNLSLSTFHVPAPGEPQPSLTVVVVDERGKEVRRVVEDSADDLPRRTSRLTPGDAIELPIDIVAPGEEALPVGTYHAYAEYGSDTAWQRTGLDVWQAGEDAVRSETVSFAVTDGG